MLSTTDAMPLSSNDAQDEGWLTASASTAGQAFLIAPEGEAHVGHDRYISSHHDPYLPNFGHELNTAGRRVVRSTSHGDWNASLGAIGANDVVLLRHSVILSGIASAHTIVIEAGGTLRFSRTSATSLRVVTLQVLKGGTLDLGTDSSPIRDVTAEIIFRDVPFDVNVDPARYGNGLIGFGTITMRGRELRETFVESAGDIRQGQISMNVADSPVDWRPGDTLLLPDSRQFYYFQGTNNLDRYEIARVASTSASSVTLASPVRYDHLGARDSLGVVQFSPHIANLSRNIILRSENPTGVRGHVMLLGMADIDIRYVEFRDLGRTTNDALNDTVFDSNGHVHHIGSNQAGRYPLHIHHLRGPDNPQANGKQFTILGNSIHSSVAVKWAIALHDSSYGLVSKNVIYNIDGAGIVTEDGSESYNIISENFISRIGGTGDRGKFTDGREGSGIWLRRPNNSVDNNVVTGAFKSAYAFYGGDNTPPPLVRIPAFQGARADGDFVFVNAETMTLQSFNGNVAYASFIGVELWYMGFRDYYDPTDLQLQQTIVRNLGLWHINNTGIFGNQVNFMRFENTKIFGDPAQLNQYNFPSGINILAAVNVEFDTLTIENMRMGVESPNRTARHDPNLDVGDVTPFTINGGRLANEENIVITTPTGNDSFERQGPRSILISNVDFARNARGTSGTNIQMKYVSGRFANLVRKDVVQVVNYDLSGQDFRLYYHEQSPDFIVPLTGSMASSGPGSPLGAPVAGLTNRQAFERYGIAIAGEVAPIDLVRPESLTVAGVVGLALTRPSAPSLTAVSPDTGNRRDLITSSRNLTISGEARPNSSVTISRNGTHVGIADANADGKWSFDMRQQPLGDGAHLFTVQNRNPDNTLIGLSSSRIVIIRTHAPQIVDSVFEIYNDSLPGEIAGRILIQDGDSGDTHAITVEPNSQFVLNSAREIRISDSARLLPNTTYSMNITVTDSAGLATTKAIPIFVSKRPAGDWVTKLRYPEFGQLTADDVVYLTNQQIASIPDAYWFSQMASSAREALSASQVQQLKNLSSIGAIQLLSNLQRSFLTPTQLNSLHYFDFEHLDAVSIRTLPPLRLSTIPDQFWFGRISAAARAVLSQEQLNKLTNLGSVGTIALLTGSQRSLLTTGQIQSLRYLDFHYLDSTNIIHLSPAQLSTLTHWYWFSRISDSARAALNANQIQQLNILGIERSITYLTPIQRSYLTAKQINSLVYSDFQYLDSSNIAVLSPAQLASIPSYYWFSTISAASRSALTQSQVASLSNLQSIGVIGLLNDQQRQWLTAGQLQTLTHLDFEFVPSNRIQLLSSAQIASIPSSYWFEKIPIAARNSLTQSQIRQINLKPSGMIALLSSTQRSMLTSSQIAQLQHSEFHYLPDPLVLSLSNSQLLTISSRYWFYRFSTTAIELLRIRGVSWVDGVGVVII